MMKFSHLMGALLLGLMLLNVLHATVSSPTLELGINEKRGDPWTTFQTDALFGTTLTLGTGSGGPVVLTPGADPNNLPDGVTICPGTLKANVVPQSVWDSGKLVPPFIGKSPYPAPAISLCPAGVAQPPLDTNPPPCSTPAPGPVTINNPIDWASTNLITCSQTDVVPPFNPLQKDLMSCMHWSKYVQASGTYSHDEWTNTPVPASENVDYEYAPAHNPTYASQKTNAGLICKGSIVVNGVSTPIIGMPGAAVISTPSFPSTGTYSVQSSMTVNECMGLNQNLPDTGSDPQRWKYYYWSNGADQTNNAHTPPAVININVAKPTTCDATVVSVNPTEFKDVLPGQVFKGVKVTVHNTQKGATAVTIQATGVSADGGWKVVPSTPPPPNGFNKDIPPDGTQDLLVDFTAPTPPPVIPNSVKLTIAFKSSTPLCNNVVCTSNSAADIKVTPKSGPSTCGCAVTSSPNPVQLNPGKDAELTASCSCTDKNGVPQPTPCPKLTWTADASLAKVDLVPKGTAKRTEPETAPYKNPAVTPAEPPKPIVDVQTFSDTPSESGNVVVSGTNGNDFTCTLPGGNKGIVINPTTCSCTMTSNDSTNILTPGKDLGLTASCACDGKSSDPNNCPALKWTQTGFSDVSLDKQIDYTTRPGKPSAPPFTSSVITPPTVPNAVLVTYDGSAPNPSAVTPAPQAGNVIATATDNSFSCQMPPGTDGKPPIKIVPTCGCNLATKPYTFPPDILVPGDDLEVDAICACTDNGGKSTLFDCGTLKWTHTFPNNDVSLDIKTAYDARPGNKPSAPPYTPSVTTTVAPHNIELVTYNGKAPYPKAVTTSQSGNVKASGSKNNVPFSCSVGPNANDNPITIGNLPDYIPQVSFVPGPSVPYGTQIKIFVSTMNQGGGKALVSTKTEMYLPSTVLPARIDETVPPLDPGVVYPLPGHEFDYDCKADGTNGGLHRLKISVDDTKLVTESDETNNIIFRDINCGNLLVCPDYI